MGLWFLPGNRLRKNIRPSRTHLHPISFKGGGGHKSIVDSRVEPPQHHSQHHVPYGTVSAAPAATTQGDRVTAPSPLHLGYPAHATCLELAAKARGAWGHGSLRPNGALPCGKEPWFGRCAGGGMRVMRVPAGDPWVPGTWSITWRVPRNVWGSNAISTHGLEHERPWGAVCMAQ